MALSALILLATLQFSFSPTQMIAAPSIAIQRGEVRKELKLTRDQAKEVDAVVKTVTTVMQGAGRQISDLTTISKAMEEADAKIWNILDEKQDERLKGLILQIKGPVAFTEPAFIEAFGLSEDQVAKLQGIRTKCRNDYLEAASGNQKKIKSVLEQAEKDSFAVLTSEQLAQYNRAIGTKIKNLSMGMPPF